MLGPEAEGERTTDPVGVTESAYSREGDTEAQWLARVASDVRANPTVAGEPVHLGRARAKMKLISGDGAK
jgi:hypothetical protein